MATPTAAQLQAFLMLAEELHFGRAAVRLFMTQPALSRQIRALERRLGVAVVERTSRSVALTPAGQALLVEARTVVDGLSRLCRVAREHARAVSGHVVIGTIGAEGAMPHVHAVLAELRRRSPDLHVELRLLNLIEHYRSLERAEVDLAFCRPPAPDGIRTLQLATEPRVVCVPTGDPLAERNAVTLADLAGRAVVSAPDACPEVWRDFWAVDPRPDGSPVVYGPVAQDVESILATVAQGQGIAFMPEAARRFFPRPGVAYVDVVGLSPCTSALAWSASRGNEPHVLAVRQAAYRPLAAADPGPAARGGRDRRDHRRSSPGPVKRSPRGDDGDRYRHRQTM
ncbi:LysR family transcriptional regulator [Actinomadura pelletieri]|uniref:LysR family transcriptional regulator n=1 Tax=Actinomadura pelletieri TaxID=111805 RepID=UPI001B8710A8|nr:LysR substrate-binding domain-containing protein [Actinomadura pelletieri]